MCFIAGNKANEFPRVQLSVIIISAFACLSNYDTSAMQSVTGSSRFIIQLLMYNTALLQRSVYRKHFNDSDLISSIKSAQWQSC